MTTIGQVPVEASELVTTRLASVVQASLMLNPNPSSAATVDTEAVASPAMHPSTVDVAIAPVITGEVVSSTLMTCVLVVVLPHASVTI